MSRVVIGTASGKPVSLDLEVLLRTRLLVQANSGGGKSWLLRRLAEQCFGKVPVILIDPEGEFATLRERHGYVLVGKGGETPADPRSASLVAQKLLELRASAVCDLYEMKVYDRYRWAKLFLDALIDAPKRLWHPTLVIGDEAHQFAPEKGAGESEAADAMIGLATRGRKRGYAAVFATQRLGKLRKDAAAELLNILIGPTFIDIDRKRAAEALGVPHSDQLKFFDQLKVLEPGLFFALGRAITTERRLVTIGSVETTHPEPGSARHAAEPPPPPDKVRALLPKLSDLPREAEARAKTEQELRADIRSLRAQLSARPVQIAEKPVDRRVQVPVLKDRQIQRLEHAGRQFERIGKTIQAAAEAAAKAGQDLVYQLSCAFPIGQPSNRSGRSPAPMRPSILLSPPISEKPAPASGREPISLRRGERRMLLTLAQRYPVKLTRAQLGTLSGFTPSGGTFGAYFGTLNRAALLTETRNGDVEITQAGLDYVGTDVPRAPETTEDLLAMWRKALRRGEAEMLRVLVEAYPKALSRTHLAEQTGFTVSGGTFGAYLGTLRRNGLIDADGEAITASATLFID